MQIAKQDKLTLIEESVKEPFNHLSDTTFLGSVYNDVLQKTESHKQAEEAVRIVRAFSRQRKEIVTTRDDNLSA